MKLYIHHVSCAIEFPAVRENLNALQNNIRGSGGGNIRSTHESSVGGVILVRDSLVDSYSTQESLIAVILHSEHADIPLPERSNQGECHI